MTEPDEQERLHVLKKAIPPETVDAERLLQPLIRILPPNRRLLHLAVEELRKRLSEGEITSQRLTDAIDFLVRAFTPSELVSAVAALQEPARTALVKLADDPSGGAIPADDPACGALTQAGLLDPASLTLREEVRAFVVAKRSEKTPGRPPEPSRSPLEAAQRILRGADAAPKEMLELAKELKQQNEFGVARRLLARARLNESRIDDDGLRLKLRQQHALCTYKDPDQPLAPRLERALEILNEDISLERTEDQETLGIAGAIHKRSWEADGQRSHLERSLGFYLRGYSSGVKDDQGYTAINAAYILDCLAAQEIEAARTAHLTPESAITRQRQANDIREEILRTLPSLPQCKGNERRDGEWWFYVTLAEAAFGLGEYEEAAFWLTKAREIPVEPWEKESTARQLSSLARMRTADQSSKDGAKARNEAPWKVIERFLGNATAAESKFIGKIGLALSGGGFRASLFHIGVLARLAELDLLRGVEVLSCVSGGSIVGAHYYLELRNLLEEKADDEITREDYIRLVQRMAEDFLAGVQTNIRTQVVAEWTTNFKMMFDSTYSRTQRAGELYEEKIYARIDRAKIRGTGSQQQRLETPLFFYDGKKYTLTITPKGEGSDFKPKYDNWRRRAKVPMLILNATTLNTGHNWQFTATFMGEPPAAIDATVDGNDRLRRMYHDAAPEPYNRLRLGHAVAASACVPGLFEPLAMEELYPGMTVRLVDGGVHDNQGIAGLLEQDANFLVVSDASGQMTVQKEPSAGLLGVPLRSNDILMARVRAAEAQDIRARRRSGLLRTLMFMHLKKDLDVDPVDWRECPDPHAASDEARPASRRTRLTTYGIRKDVQERIAALRTDLDSFTDVEAFALMTSGYRMAEREFTEHVKDLDRGDDKRDWSFLQIEQHLNLSKANDSAAASVLRQLEVGSQLAFKIWRLSKKLQVGAYVLGAIAVLLIAGLLWHWRAHTLVSVSYGAIGAVLLGVVATAILGKAIMRVLSFSSEIRRILIGAVMCIVGFLVARLHLHVFDPWFLKGGKLEHLRTYQPHRTHKDLRVWLSLAAGALLWLCLTLWGHNTAGM